jgi:hypothetical protein
VPDGRRLYSPPDLGCWGQGVSGANPHLATLTGVLTPVALAACPSADGGSEGTCCKSSLCAEEQATIHGPHGFFGSQPKGPGYTPRGCRQKGGCRQAYMDVLTASLGGCNQAPKKRKTQVHNV